MEKHVYLVSSWGRTVPQDTLVDCIYQIADQIGVEEGEICLYTYGLTYQDVSSKQLCTFVRKEVDEKTVLELQGINGKYTIPCSKIGRCLPSELCEALGFKHTRYNTFTIVVGGVEYSEFIQEW